MSDPRIVYPTMAVLIAGLAFELYLLRVIRRANRASRRLPEAIWYFTAGIELAVPLAMILLLHRFSPLGMVAALSAPVLLVLPMVVMLSVLHLQPRMTLMIGVIAAAAHLLLVLDTIRIERPDPSTYPRMKTYPTLLLFCGLRGRG